MKQTNKNMSERDRSIIERIVTSAKKKGVSLTELSVAINKSPNYLSTMRYTGYNVPCSVVFQIADLLEVDPVYLLTGRQVDNQEKMLREKLSKAILDSNEVSYDALCLLYGLWRVLPLGNTPMSK